jgi:hypothetical protein
LNVRLGIASGLVIVGDLIGAGAAQERGVVGDTRTWRQPGILLIADGSRRQIGALVEIEDPGRRTSPVLPSRSPRTAWAAKALAQSLRGVAIAGRCRSSARPSLDRLPAPDGRRKTASRRVVPLPGIDKSRLAAGLCDRASRASHVRGCAISARCSIRQCALPIHC